jgi:hypothetical protein
MSKAIVNFKWYRIDNEGRLKEPYCENNSKHGYPEYLENDHGFDSEVEAVSALTKFIGDETYESSSYILIKSYIITNSRW